MYIDALPILSFARLLRNGARNVALRNESRATGMVGLSNGDLVPSDTIVRFDIAAGEDPAQQLAAAFASTGARAFWFYGGDEVARRAVGGLKLSAAASGAVFARRMDPERRADHIVLRPPGVDDRRTLGDIRAEHAPGFSAPETHFAMRGDDIVGVALSEALDALWTEVRVSVHPAHRGHGYGTAIVAAVADKLEGAGRLVCAALDTPAARGRGALERAGFRLTDYYLTARSG